MESVQGPVSVPVCGSFGPDVEEPLDIDRKLYDLLGAHAGSVVMEDHAGLDVQRVVEETAVVTHPGAVVDMLRGGVERLSGIETVEPVGCPGRGVGGVVAQGLEVLAEVEVVLDLDAPS